MVGHDIDDNAYSPVVRARNEIGELPQRPEPWIYATIVSDIIPTIRKWRGIERREPQCVHTEVMQVVQSINDAAEITFPVTVGIIERPGIHLETTAFLHQLSALLSA